MPPQKANQTKPSPKPSPHRNSHTLLTVISDPTLASDQVDPPAQVAVTDHLSNRVMATTLHRSASAKPRRSIGLPNTLIKAVDRDSHLGDEFDHEKRLLLPFAGEQFTERLAVLSVGDFVRVRCHRWFLLVVENKYAKQTS